MIRPGRGDGERSPLGRSVLHAVGFGVLSLILGMVQFTVPGIAWAISDLREVGLLIGVFHLPHWWLTLIPAAITALPTPEEGSLLSVLVVHVIGAPVAWFGVRWLCRRIQHDAVLGVSWVVFVAAWYLVVLLPVLAVTNWMVGMIALDEVIDSYGALVRIIPYELITTAGVTALYLTNIRELGRRRRTEAELRRREAWISGILAAVPVGLAVAEKGRLIYANQRLADLVGADREALLHRPIDELLRPRGSDAPVTEPGGTAGTNHALRTADGDELEVVVHAASSGPNLEQTTLSVTDVTERSRLERQLRQAQKMDALGQLSGGVAHDFNNMLTIMSLSLDRVERRWRRGDDIGRELAIVADALSQSKSVVEQLLSFARRQPSEPRPIDLGELMRRAMPIMSGLLGNSISVRVDIASDLPPIVADPAMIEQLLMNLLINARDALAEAEEEPREIETRVAPIAGADGESRIRLSVRDTGVGMDEATRARVFEPFFTTKPEGAGTGLGLATVYGIVRQHGALIEVESAPGRGSTFHIDWPVSDRPEPVARRHIGAERRAPTSG